MTTTGLTRLHISPLTQDLLPTVLGPRLAQSAENIAYQTLPAFPENNYGYIDLPSVEAKKLITKLNGAILKGRKMKVEQARPKKRSARETADDEPVAEKPRKKSKKVKLDKKVIEGHELSTDRKVKRGWTEPKKDSKKSGSKDKSSKKQKQQATSKYSETEELLFRTELPENKSDLDTGKKSKKKTLKDGKVSRESVVHEFQKHTAQPSFLRDNTQGTKPSTEFVEGTGWVDAEGNTIQEEPKSLVERRKKPAKANGLAINIPSPVTKPKVRATPRSSSPTDSASVQSSSDESSIQEPAKQTTIEADDETSSSGSSSSDSESGSDTNVDVADEHAEKTPSTPPKVHPLEALYKKPSKQESPGKPSLGIETHFSFFGQNADENDLEDDDLPPMPVTPYTSQDLYSRNTRSAAPTPDTAHPSRFTSFAEQLANRHTDASEYVSRDGSVEIGQSSTAATPAKGESEFEKRFWQERGANNKAWKNSRRTALKDQRQKQNRLRPSRLGK